MAAPVEGTCQPRFAAVQDAFAWNFAEHGEVGAAVAVWLDGALAVDLWGGHADTARTRPWTAETLVCCMSVAKAATAAACAALLGRGGGGLELDAPVARYWPEFAASGKDQVEVGWCLDHCAGLPWLAARNQPDEAFADWGWVTGALATQAPVTQPGAWRGYHVVTMGYLAGELVRRVTGVTLGQYLREAVAGPLGAEFHIGLDAALDARCAEFHGRLEGTLLRPADPDSLPARCVALLRDADFNGRRFRAAEVPAINGHCSARGAARLFGRLAEIHAGDTSGPLSPEALRTATRLRWDGQEAVLGHHRRMAAGFALGTPGHLPFGLHLESFGHTGAGGAVAFADPIAGLGFAYVMNSFYAGPAPNPRVTRLVEAVYQVLEAG
jgi:CubicO group peptidase (beta-lactamase class C family)